VVLIRWLRVMNSRNVTCETRTNNDNKQTMTTDKQKTENQQKKAKPSFGVFIKFSSRNVSL